MNINLTLFGQMITFILFVWFTKQFVWPPIVKALKDRQAKIADGLAAAERGHLELQQAQEQARLEIKRSKNEAADIILESKKQADTLLEHARQQAREEGRRIIQQAHAEVAHMVSEAKETLRKQVATIALQAAEKVLAHSIDPALHHKMLEELAQEI